MRLLLFLLLLLGLSAQAQIITSPGGGGGGGIPSTSAANIAYLSASADITANGVAFTNAVNSLPVSMNSLLVVGPGEFYIPNTSTNLLKALGRMYCYPGCKITKGVITDTAIGLFMINDSAFSTGITNEIAGYGEFYFTNGNTSAASALLVESKTTSKIRMECNLAWQVGGVNQCIWIYGNTCDFTYDAKDFTRSDGYDTFTIVGSSGLTAHVSSKKAYAGGSIVEATGVPGGIPGQITVWIDYGEKLSSGTTFGAMVIGEGVYVRCNVIVINACDSIWANPTNCTSCLGTGTLEGSILYTAAGGCAIVQAIDPTANTAFTLKGYTIFGPPNVDPLCIQTFNGTTAGAIFTMENCRIVEGASATNWIRMDNSAGVSAQCRIAQVSTRRQLSAHTNVTVWSDRRVDIVNSMTPVFNAGVAATNLQVTHIVKNTLTNNGDYLDIRATGQTLAGGTNRVQLILGSETVADSGTITNNSSGGWQLHAKISRSSINSKAQATSWDFSTVGVGIPFSYTNGAGLLAQTNGITTALRLVSTSQTHGSITNNEWNVDFFPAQ